MRAKSLNYSRLIQHITKFHAYTYCNCINVRRHTQSTQTANFSQINIYFTKQPYIVKIIYKGGKGQKRPKLCLRSKSMAGSYIRLTHFYNSKVRFQYTTYLLSCFSKLKFFNCFKKWELLIYMELLIQCCIILHKVTNCSHHSKLKLKIKSRTRP